MRNMDDGGGGDGTRDAKLDAIVASLDLDGHPELNKPGSPDLETAILEEHSRDVVLWAQLKPFLAAYAKVFPQTDVNDRDIEQALEEAVDEPIFFLTVAILKQHLRKEKPHNLSSLAAVRFKKHTRKWERWQDHLSDISFDAMSTRLRVWKVTTISRKASRGGNIAGYRIEAGQALLDFHERVYHRKRQNMMRAFYVKYLSN